MLVIELEGNITKMQGEKFIKAYERVSKAKKKLEQGIEDLKELGIKVNVDYLNIRRDKKE